MKFVIEQEVDGEFCIQECKCANEEEFVEKDGKCEDTKKIKQVFMEISLAVFYCSLNSLDICFTQITSLN